MLQKLKIKTIDWIDGAKLWEEEVRKIIKKYNFHELDIEACLEDNQRARIDSYDDYIFMVLHFPKYNSYKKTYELNEFNIFLGKNFLITFRNFPGTKTSTIFKNYKDLKIDKNSEFKITSGFILYEIIQAMLEKVFKTLDNITKDLKELEKKVFENTSSSLVKDLMIKKRNIVVLKHMLLPQITVMKRLEDEMNKLFSDEMEVYFEDLEDKVAHVVNDIKILEEYIDSIEDAFKSIIDIQTNNVIRLLTIFSAFLLPLTLITSFYWMNIELPFSNSPLFIYIILWVSILMMFSIYYYLNRKGKL